MEIFRVKGSFIRHFASRLTESFLKGLSTFSVSLKKNSEKSMGREEARDTFRSWRNIQLTFAYIRMVNLQAILRIYAISCPCKFGTGWNSVHRNDRIREITCPTRPCETPSLTLHPHQHTLQITRALVARRPPIFIIYTLLSELLLKDNSRT